MGFQSSQSAYKPSPFIIFWGLNAAEVPTEEVVQSLQNRSIDPKTPYRTFTLNGGTTGGLYHYWASPVSAGEVEFLDVESGFTGGWDGAHNDIWNPELYGPVTIDVLTESGIVVPYYVYRTDHNDLGPVTWTSSLSTGH